MASVFLTSGVLCGVFSSSLGPSSPTKRDAAAAAAAKAKRDSFSDFETNTNDAWDDADDDLIMMANVKMSLKDVHTSARAVIDSHARQMRRQDEREERVRHQLNVAAKNDVVSSWLSSTDPPNGASNLDTSRSSQNPSGEKTSVCM